MKKLAYIIGMVILIASCSTYRKVQVIKDALSKNDSSNIAIPSKPKIDSAAIVESIVSKIELAKIDFVTMNARCKVDYETLKNADNYIVNVSIQKDKAIYVTVRGAMGVIGLKALIQKDTVVLIYPLSKKIERKPLSYLKEIISFKYYNMMDETFLVNRIKQEMCKVSLDFLNDLKKPIAYLSKSKNVFNSF